MDPQKFLADIGAEIVTNRAIVNIGGERTVVARIMGGSMILTEEGEAMARSIGAGKAEKPKRKPRAKPEPSGLSDPDQLDFDI